MLISFPFLESTFAHKFKILFRKQSRKEREAAISLVFRARTNSRKLRQTATEVGKNQAFWWAKSALNCVSFPRNPFTEWQHAEASSAPEFSSWGWCTMTWTNVRFAGCYLENATPQNLKGIYDTWYHIYGRSGVAKSLFTHAPLHRILPTSLDMLRAVAGSEKRARQKTAPADWSYVY